MGGITRYFLFAGVFISACGEAQTVSVRTDRNQILIGEPVEYFLSVDLPVGGSHAEMHFPDSIAHFDVIKTQEPQISKRNAREFRVVLTSFDSGSWYIPQIPVRITRNAATQTFLGDSVLINVDYSQPDSTDALRDIKPIIEIEVRDYFWWYLALALMGALLLLLVITNYFKKRRARPAPVFHSKLSAFEEAMAALASLDQHDLTTDAGTRRFYTELSKLFRTYYSRTIRKDVMNQTTGDLLIICKTVSRFPELVSSLAAPLRVCDAVKFAKYRPQVAESEHTRTAIKTAIEEIESKKTAPGAS